jgi:hypothetical protein
MVRCRLHSLSLALLRFASLRFASLRFASFRFASPCFDFLSSLASLRFSSRSFYVLLRAALLCFHSLPYFQSCFHSFLYTMLPYHYLTSLHSTYNLQMNKRLDLMEAVDTELRDSTVALLKRLSELSEANFAHLGDNLTANSAGIDEGRLIGLG